MNYCVLQIFILEFETVLKIQNGWNHHSHFVLPTPLSTFPSNISLPVQPLAPCYGSIILSPCISATTFTCGDVSCRCNASSVLLGREREGHLVCVCGVLKEYVGVCVVDGRWKEGWTKTKVSAIRITSCIESSSCPKLIDDRDRGWGKCTWHHK